MNFIPQYVTYYFIYIVVVVAIFIIALTILSIRLLQLSKKLSLLKQSTVTQANVQKERDDFLAMLVHELRSPLSIMKGASDLILKDAHNLNKSQIEILLTQIRTSSSDMIKIVNDILDISKIESGKFSVNKVFGNVNKTIIDECDYFMTLANVRNIKIEHVLDESLPSFNFDQERTRQVLNNLLSNAINYIKEDGHILVTSKKNQKIAEIVVSDSGDGISDELKPRLFTKFVQLNSHVKGSGLGLAIAKGIIESHGGEIKAEDNLPNGAKFIFTLPLS